jgi:hypothetical protein
VVQAPVTSLLSHVVGIFAPRAGPVDLAYVQTLQPTLRPSVRPSVPRVQVAGISTASGAFTIKRLEFKVGAAGWSDASPVPDAVPVRFKLAVSGMGVR